MRVYGSSLEVVFYGSKRLVKFTGRVYELLLWLIFYGVEFCVEFMCGLSSSNSWSKLRLHCGARIERTSLRSTLLDWSTTRIYMSSIWANFTDQVNEPILVTVFTGLALLFSVVSIL